MRLATFCRSILPLLFVSIAPFCPSNGQSTLNTSAINAIVIPKDHQLSFGNISTTDLEKSSARPKLREGQSPRQTANLFETLPANQKTTSRRSATDDGWHFAFAPYLYATGISGTIGARGRTIQIDSSFGDVWKKLDLGLMGTVEARKNKLLVFTDIIWVKLSDERDTQGGLFSTAKVGINLFILDPEVGYRLSESKKAFFHILGGVRIWSVETNLNVTTGTLPGFDVSQR